MDTTSNEVPTPVKEVQSENTLIRIDKVELAKKVDKKSAGEDPKPRIVLTFRTEKAGLKSSNMKIVSTEDKSEDLCKDRPTRSHGNDSDVQDEEICDSLPKKSKSSISETDETADYSNSSTKRSVRNLSKGFSVTNITSKKEKSLNEAITTVQRPSRKIKPTAKALAIKELRMGLETLNNARAGTSSDKSPEEGVRTRRSAQNNLYGLLQVSTNKRRKHVPNSSHQSKVERNDKQKKEAEIEDPEAHRLNKLKKKHFSILGLKAIDVKKSLENEVDDSTMDSTKSEANEEKHLNHQKELKATSKSKEVVVEEQIEEEEVKDDEDLAEEIEDWNDNDDESSVDKASQDSDSTYSSGKELYVSSKKKKQKHDRARPEPKDQKEARRLSRRRRRHQSEDESELNEELELNYWNKQHQKQCSGSDSEYDGAKPTRRSNRRRTRREGSSSPVINEDICVDPPEGDEVPEAEATCPDDDCDTQGACLCEERSNLFAAPDELEGDAVFCRAVETVDGARAGCSHPALKAADGALAALVRAGPRAPYILACRQHTAQLRRHMCCPSCGVFCTQGIFYQCSRGHLFHLDCGIFYQCHSSNFFHLDPKVPPGCPHCGAHQQFWHPKNRDCWKVRVDIKSSNNRVFLPEQRMQCTPAYLGFSKLRTSAVDTGPCIPEELLPSPPVDLKALLEKQASPDYDELLAGSPDQTLRDAIAERQGTDELIKKLVGVDVNKTVEGCSGGSFMHLAAKCGNLSALYLLQYAGADLDKTDSAQRTPLMLAVLALHEKPNSKNSKSKKRSSNEASMDVDEKETDKAGEVSDRDDKTEARDDSPSDEMLVKVIRYLVAAGCDINYAGPEGMTALHMAAQHGGADTCSALLDAAHCELDPRDHGGWTPLVWAAENCHAEVVRLLVRRGADASAADGEGNAVIHWCALGGDSLSLRLLLDARSDVNALNAHSDTPLHVAARQGHYPCVVVLLARGAKTNIENSSGQLPVEVCSGQCQTAISLNMQMALAVKDKAAKYTLLSSDISRGREQYPVPCINEVDDAPLPDDFTYVAAHVMPKQVAIDNTLATTQGCTCKEDDCSSDTCACCMLGVRRWFQRGRLLPAFPYHEPPMLFECNQTCSCHLRQCDNTVVSRATRHGSLATRAQVFRAGGARGWGLRAEGAVPRGAPVAVYCGELLTADDADARPGDHYMFAMHINSDLLEQCKDKTQLCVDAATYGSAARFINHSCHPNLAPVRVFTASRDLRLPTITLFAIRDIAPREEFTFDYGEKFWSVKSKWMTCECGTPECRYRTRTKEEPA